MKLGLIDRIKLFFYLIWNYLNLSFIQDNEVEKVSKKYYYDRYKEGKKLEDFLRNKKKQNSEHKLSFNDALQNTQKRGAVDIAARINPIRKEGELNSHITHKNQYNNIVNLDRFSSWNSTVDLNFVNDSIIQMMSNNSTNTRDYNKYNPIILNNLELNNFNNDIVAINKGLQRNLGFKVLDNGNLIFKEPKKIHINQGNNLKKIDYNKFSIGFSDVEYYSNKYNPIETNLFSETFKSTANSYISGSINLGASKNIISHGALLNRGIEGSNLFYPQQYDYEKFVIKSNPEEFIKTEITKGINKAKNDIISIIDNNYYDRFITQNKILLAEDLIPVILPDIKRTIYRTVEEILDLRFRELEKLNKDEKKVELIKSVFDCFSLPGSLVNVGIDLYRNLKK